MSKIRHLLNAPSREFVQNDQRGIPQLFPHTKTNLKQLFLNVFMLWAIHSNLVSLILYSCIYIYIYSYYIGPMGPLRSEPAPPPWGAGALFNIFSHKVAITRRIVVIYGRFDIQVAC